MTDALVPTTALVPAEEFQRRLPEGWLLRGYQARIGYDDWVQPDRILDVELWHHYGARVDLTMRATPDWEWLAAYLRLVEGIPPDLRVDADRRQ